MFKHHQHFEQLKLKLHIHVQKLLQYMSDVERPQVIAQRDDLARCLQQERSAALASACSKRLRI
jgi:hypothetical protein